MALKPLRDFIGRIFNKNTNVITYSADSEGLLYNKNNEELRVHINGADREIITDSGTDTFTNKTIDADLNTISNIANDEIKAGAAIDATKIADGSVSNTEFQYLDGVTSDIQPQLDAKVDETGGTLTGGSVIDSIVDFNTATNTSKLVLPQDTKVSLDALTREEGRLYYANDEDSVYFDNGSELVPVGAGSSLRVNQTGHGLVALDAIYHNGTSWVKAIATSELTQATHIVSMTLDANNFIAENSARIEVPSHGLTVGAYYYLSQTTAGASTSLQPLSGLDNQLFKVESVDFILVDVKRAIVRAKNQINYIENSDIELRTEKFVTYADAAQATPVDGVGGTPNVTIARNTTLPLRGVADLLFTKDAANRQGQGYAYDFTIDRADRAQMLRVGFDYSTSANYLDSDLTVYIYDVTNSRIIDVVDNSIQANVNGLFLGSFQTSIDSTSYRLIIHVASTNALAYTVNFDNFSVAKQTLVRGIIETKEESYTPTITGAGTVTSVDVRYKRLGEELIIWGSFVTGTVAATPPAISLPNNLTVKTVIQSPDGEWLQNLAGANQIKRGSLVANDGQQSLSFRTTEYVLALSPLGAQNGNQIWTNTTAVRFKARVRIQGWDASATLSEDFGNRDISFMARGTVNQSIPNNTQTKVTGFNNILKDSVSGWNSTNQEYTVQQSGDYVLGFNANFAINAAGNRFVGYRKNGVLQYISGHGPVAVNSTSTSGVAFLSDLKKGDILDFAVLQNSGAAVNLNFNTAGAQTEVFIFKKDSPQTLAGGEVVHCRYETNAGQAVVDGNTILFEDKIEDTHNAYNPLTGIFTAPFSDYYTFETTILTNTVATTAGQYLATNVYENTDLRNNYSQLTRVQVTGPTLSFGANQTTTIYLRKGKQASVRFFETLAAVNLLNNAEFNKLTITNGR
jgi:hypothetical protein